MRSYGYIVRTKRELDGISIRKFAGKVGLSVGGLAFMESGKRGAPAEDMTFVIARALGIDPTVLVAAALREHGWPKVAEFVEQAELFAHGQGEEAEW